MSQEGTVKPLDLRSVMSKGQPASTGAVPSASKDQANKSTSTNKQSKWFYFCHRPNFGFMHEPTRTRHAAKGNYFVTTSKEIADYIETHYKNYMQEITEAMHKDAHTIKEEKE